MDVALTPEYILALGSLALLSISDLRDRSLPGVRIFFWASVCFGLVRDPVGNSFTILAILLTVWWSSRLSAPTLLILPTVFLPATWPVLLTAGGVRRGRVAQGDLLALGAITCLLPWYGPLLAFLGALFWSRMEQEKMTGSIPAIPGVFIGVVTFILLNSLFPR